MRRYLCIAVLCSLFAVAGAQTEPQFTQYMYNQYLFNPAYAGCLDCIEGSLLYRNQYVNLTTRPIQTEGFNFNSPIVKASSGIGVTLINDQIGWQRSTYLSLNYDYRKTFGWGKVGVGVGLGFVQTSLNGAELRASDGDYTGGTVNHNDPDLPNTNVNGISPDLSLGLYISKDDKYFAGAAMNHIEWASAKINVSAGTTDLNFARNLFITGGYDFQLTKKLSLMPSTIIKTDLKQVQVDLGGTFTIINNILAGITFRGYDKNTIDALSFVLGVKYKGFRLVYSYDANLSYLSNFNSGTHEISVRYCYGLKKKEVPGYLYHNPRYD